MSGTQPRWCSESAVVKIVTGGQTGADRAALDVALEYGMDDGGWVPRGRIAEDGRIPEIYPSLVEADSEEPAERTRRNVRDSEATLILSHGELQGGSRLTFDEAQRLHRPTLHINLQVLSIPSAEERLSAWLRTCRPEVLNVAGPRASEDGDIYEAVKSLLRVAFKPMATRRLLV